MTVLAAFVAYSRSRPRNKAALAKSASISDVDLKLGFPGRPRPIFVEYFNNAIQSTLQATWHAMASLRGGIEACANESPQCSDCMMLRCIPNYSYNTGKSDNSRHPTGKDLSMAVMVCLTLPLKECYIFIHLFILRHKATSIPPNLNSTKIYLSCLEGKSSNIWTANISGHSLCTL